MFVWFKVYVFGYPHLVVYQLCGHAYLSGLSFYVFRYPQLVIYQLFSFLATHERS